MSENKKKRKLKKKWIILILALILLIACGIVFAVHRSSASEDTGDEEYEQTTAMVEKMDVTKTISSDGEIGSSITEKLVPHASYKLGKINASKSQAICEGHTILTYTNGQTMVAPYDCVIESYSLPDLQKTLTNNHYVKIKGTKILKIELQVDESEILDVQKGDQAKVEVSATDQTYDGEVSFVSDIGEYSDGTSTFLVRVIFENDGNIKLGMNGKATISMGDAKNVLAVPKGAVYNDGEDYYVSVQKGKTTKEVPVEIGLEGDEYTEIKSGLKEGQTVLVTESSEDSEEEYYEEEYY